MHPIYGEFQLGWRIIPDFPNYEINEFCSIRNSITKRIIKPTQHFQIALQKNCKPHTRRIYHLGLLAFFPHIEPLETVDHIDECRSNHYISNLQWSTNRNNAIKSNQLRPRKRKNQDTQRYIQQWNLHDASVLICEYTPTELKIAGYSIHQVRKCMSGILKEYSQSKWTKKLEMYSDLPGEEWKTSDALKERLRSVKYGGHRISEKYVNQIQVSNRGRILLANGQKSYGVKLQHTVYRRAFSVKMHVLVWDVWGSRKKSIGEVILHDDSQPPDSEGCVSNDIRHLRLGTQRENIMEWHAKKRLKVTN